MNTRCTIVLAGLTFVMATTWLGGTLVAADGAKELLTYFGTYTNSGKSKGIYCYKLDLATGKLTSVGRDRGDQESVVSGDSSERQVPVRGERGQRCDGKPGGAVSAFALDRKTGELTPLNHQSSEGAGPCHVSVDKTGKVAMVANYGSGSIASLPIKADGSLDKAASAIQHEGSSVDPRPASRRRTPTRSTSRPTTASPSRPTWVSTRC